MSKKNKPSAKAAYPLPVRLLCIILSVLVSSGILVYLVALILELFSK